LAVAATEKSEETEAWTKRHCASSFHANARWLQESHIFFFRPRDNGFRTGYNRWCFTGGLGEGDEGGINMEWRLWLRDGLASASRRWFGVVSPLVLVQAGFALGQQNEAAKPQEPNVGQPAASQADPSPKDATSQQPNAPAQSPDAAAQAKPSETEALPAIVTEVSGSVEWALADVSVLAKEGWTPVKLNDSLHPGTQLRTGLRSCVILKFGETTLISVRSATHASIDQFYKSATTEHIRVGLGYGTVRGGSTEGEIRADVLIDSTVATLAKRGTEGWQMNVEPVTGRFNISLAEFGLVEAIRKTRDANRLSKTVRPGEYVTNANIGNLWIKQDIFNRNVTFFQADAVTAADANFNTTNTRGYAVISPGGGANLTASAYRNSANFVLDQLAARNPGSRPNTAILEPGIRGRPEGNFGTGGIFKARLPSMIAAAKALPRRPAIGR